MANIAYDIRNGIYDFLLGTGHTTLRAALAKTVHGTTYHRLYYEQAPQAFPGGVANVTPPYVVFTLLPIDPDRDSVTKIYRVWVQLLVVSLSLAECENIAGYVTDVMDDSEGTLTVGTYKVVEVRRQPQLALAPAEGVHSIVVQYSLIIHN